MTNEQILTKAIQKAIDSGYDGKGMLAEVRKGSPLTIEAFIQPNVIFNHDFAKALWGENTFSVDEDGTVENCGHNEEFVYSYDYIEPSYQWHLQQMVIANEPIKYLSEHL